MEKAPTSVKIIAVLGMLSGIAGWAIAFKLPGTIAFVPLFLSLVLGLAAFMMARKKKVSCPGGYITMGIAIIGIIITLTLQGKEVVVAVDEKQEQVIEKTDQVITEGEDLNDALDELDDLE